MVIRPNGWIIAKVIDLQNAGLLLVEDGNHGEYRPRQEEFVDDGVSFIRAADMNNGQVLFDSAQKINSEARNRIRKGIGLGGDVLLSHKGTVGKVAYVPLDAPPFVCSPQTTFWRTLDNEKIDRRYLTSYLNSHAFQSQLFSRQNETDMAGYVSLTTQRTLEIILPPLPEQKAIAHILGTLDDKIELNRQMNATLEAMAQALFQSWFVDFDPVIDNALAAGHPIPDALQERAAARAALGHRRQPLPAAIQSQFPSRFVRHEEMGWVPAGWEKGNFGDVATHVKDNVRAEDVGDFNFYVGLEHIGRKQIFLDDNGAGDSVESNKSKFQEMDLLFGKLRPYFHKVCLAPCDGICSTDILVFRSRREAGHSFMTLAAYTDEFVEYANMRSTGTRMPRSSAQDILNYPIVIPPNGILESFDKVIMPTWKKGMESVAGSRVLANLRDTLLPKLLSGALRVAAGV
jgi:type I restriction enzyme S subunit